MKFPRDVDARDLIKALERIETAWFDNPAAMYDCRVQSLHRTRSRSRNMLRCAWARSPRFSRMLPNIGA